MRKQNENYSTIYLLGNNSRDIVFMKYLFLSQNAIPLYCDKIKINDNNVEQILKNIALFFGNNGPFLLDNKGLMEIIDSNVEKIEDTPLELTGEEIVEQINMALNSDAVYLCDSSGKINKIAMFILGYLMAKKQEIFLWSEIDESEWLMNCISKINNGKNNIVQFPLDLIRSLAFPYLLKKNNIDIEVKRNTEFNLLVDNCEEEKKTVVLLGSLTKQLNRIREEAKKYSLAGYDVLAPKLSRVKKNENGFVIFEDDISTNPISIESDFIKNCLKAEEVVVCDEDGYIGNTVMFEIGYLLATNKKISFVQEPNDKWLNDCINIMNKGKLSK